MVLRNGYLSVQISGCAYAPDAKGITLRESDRHSGDTSGDFHNVYVNPEAFASYLSMGKFPEKTVLVMDKFASVRKEPQNVVQKGLFPGRHLGFEVAVKNRNHPDLQTTDWAYYDFSGLQPGQSAKAFADKDCYQCHKQHASDDNVWVQFYPILRDQKQRDKLRE